VNVATRRAQRSVVNRGVSSMSPGLQTSPGSRSQALSTARTPRTVEVVPLGGQRRGVLRLTVTTQVVLARALPALNQHDCIHIFYNNFNNRCPITIIFGTVSSKSASSKDGFISHLTYLVQLPYLGKSQNTKK